ncbi:MAG: phosphoadenylyl-sulfate reductase [Alphaproteobacteria bacterium]|nr:phosphoadenylyl-sulfate reductase [Alphaproteobacteria bacterium]
MAPPAEFDATNEFSFSTSIGTTSPSAELPDRVGGSNDNRNSTPLPRGRAADLVGTLAAQFGHLPGTELLKRVVKDIFPGQIALVSSFGIEAALLLSMVADIDPTTPVLFIDSGKLFGETLRYRDKLIGFLGLRDVRSVLPDPKRLAADDPDGRLWHDDPDRCCRIRKVEPLQAALAGFAAWISGRKRYQSTARADLPMLEAVEGRIKVNPLAFWTRAEIDAEFARRGLPRHPLEADGYPSIGCMPCTDRVRAGEDSRAGRWRGLDKSECGIHLPARLT